jgi:hypothetical protein
VKICHVSSPLPFWRRETTTKEKIKEKKKKRELTALFFHISF